MLEGIKILIQRIEASDKDVEDWIEKARDDVLTEPDLSNGQVEQFTQEEKDAVRAAVVAHYRREFNAEIMDMISGKDETEEERGPLTKKMVINQAQLQLIKAMAEQDREFFGKAPIKKEGSSWTPF